MRVCWNFGKVRRLTSSSRIHGALQNANKVLNKLASYEEVEAAKEAVSRAEHKLFSVRKGFQKAKAEFEKVSVQQHHQQKKINELLHRKPEWESTELVEFTELCQTEHEITKASQSAKQHLVEAEKEVDLSLTTYLNALREHYHQEQVWAEKGRRISTFFSFGLVVFNSLLFLISIFVVEPRKRESVAKRVFDMNIESQRRRDEELRDFVLSRLPAESEKEEIQEFHSEVETNLTWQEYISIASLIGITMVLALK